MLYLLFFLLATFAGVVQVLAPDHWMPMSLASWQRSWGPLKTISYAAGAFLLHILLGIAIFFLLRLFVSDVDSMTFFRVALAGVMLSFLVRSLRYKRINEVLRMGGGEISKTFTLLSFLGPCEVFVPILAKSHQLGFGYLPACFALGAGTFFGGIALVCCGRLMWNRPFVLIRAMDWASAGRSVLPITLAVSFGLCSLLWQ